MGHTPIVRFATVAAAAAALCILATRPAMAGPRTEALTGSDKKPARAPVIPDEYRVNPGDRLRIEVYKDPQLSQSVQVRPDGKITLPLIGDVEAVGHTPIELRDRIAKELKDYITNPTVTVIAVETTAPRAYVIGEVNHPGAVNLQPPLTVLQALALAGGLKDFADEKNIRILRKSPGDAIPFNYKDALKSGRDPIYLQAGDTVVVPD